MNVIKLVASHRVKSQLKVPAESADAPATPGATASEGTPPPPLTPSVVPARLPAAAAPVVTEPAQEVVDEMCPDTVYTSEQIGDETGNVEGTAFRCHECRMLYLPETHREGNPITDFEKCRRHIGVKKCDSCARVIVSLARIRCHRQVCPNSG